MCDTMPPKFDTDDLWVACCPDDVSITEVFTSAVAAQDWANISNRSFEAMKAHIHPGSTMQPFKVMTLTDALLEMSAEAWRDGQDSTRRD